MSRSRDAVALDDVEAQLGHRFGDRMLLRQGLTHISALAADKSRVTSYQRLEFLGDRVLGLVVSAMLFEAFPEAEEGELSRRLAALVRRETCAEVGIEWGLGAAILLGDSEVASGGREKPAILSDVCEAMVGAVFLDGGYAAADGLVRRVWTSRMLEPTRPLRDPKTALQEWAQALGKSTPTYRETSRSGPAHAPEFTVAVCVDGHDRAEGNGSSKRTAEQAAAQAFLTRQGLLPHAEPVMK